MVLPAPTVAARILVIEDDRNVADVVGRYLTREGYVVGIEHDGLTGLRRALEDLPDLVVLDLMLPGLNGVEVCRRLRAVAPVPVIMLTARGDEADRIAGLEFGADDYVAKPFSPRELTARAKAVLRRASGATSPGAGTAVVTGGGIRLDPSSREVQRGDEQLMLTAREFDLLSHLMRHPRVAFRREHLLEEVWGFSFGDTSTVTVHVRRIREKIESDPSKPEHLRTVRGVGYRFDP